MKHKAALMIGLAMAILLSVTIVNSQQKSHASASQQDKIAALKDLRDSGVITADEYDAKVTALKASAPSAATSGHVAKASWGSGTRKVEITDPQYQMTAYTIEVPSNWKFAGVMARDGGCHGVSPALKFTAQSSDGSITLAQLPGVQWAWNTNEQARKFAEKANCADVDIESASAFLTKIVVPNLARNAKVLSVQPLDAEGEASLAKQLDGMKQQNAKMAQQYGQSPQKLTLDGARVRVQYEQDGHAMEEEIGAVVNCVGSHRNAMYAMPAADNLACNSRGEWITRAPLGQLDAVLAQPQFKAMGKSLTINQEWDMRAAQDAQAAFQKTQAANNAQFQTNLKNNQAQFEQRLQNQKRFDANLKASTDRALAVDRARQNAIDASAHNTANYSLDRQDYTNPTTGQTITADSGYNHQWISSDGSTLIQTQDHTFDPNGVVYPVSQSWSELVPK